MKAMGTGAVDGRRLGDRRAVARHGGALAALYRRTAAAQGIGPLARAELDAVAPVVTAFGHAAPAAALPGRALHRRPAIGLGDRSRRRPRHRRRCAVEVRRDHPRLPPAGLCRPDDAHARLRHPRRPAPAGADLATGATGGWRTGRAWTNIRIGRATGHWGEMGAWPRRRRNSLSDFHRILRESAIWPFWEVCDEVMLSEPRAPDSRADLALEGPRSPSSNAPAARCRWKTPSAAR